MVQVTEGQRVAMGQLVSSHVGLLWHGISKGPGSCHFGVIPFGLPFGLPFVHVLRRMFLYLLGLLWMQLLILS